MSGAGTKLDTAPHTLEIQAVLWMVCRDGGGAPGMRLRGATAAPWILPEQGVHLVIHGQTK